GWRARGTAPRALRVRTPLGPSPPVGLALPDPPPVLADLTVVLLRRAPIAANLLGVVADFLRVLGGIAGERASGKEAQTKKQAGGHTHASLLWTSLARVGSALQVASAAPRSGSRNPRLRSLAWTSLARVGSALQVASAAPRSGSRTPRLRSLARLPRLLRTP